MEIIKMKHQLVKQLKVKNKALKKQIKELEKRKLNYSNSIAELIDHSTNIESLNKHFQRNKYNS